MPRKGLYVTVTDEGSEIHSVAGKQFISKRERPKKEERVFEKTISMNGEEWELIALIRDEDSPHVHGLYWNGEDRLRKTDVLTPNREDDDDDAQYPRSFVPKKVNASTRMVGVEAGYVIEWTPWDRPDQDDHEVEISVKDRLEDKVVLGLDDEDLSIRREHEKYGKLHALYRDGDERVALYFNVDSETYYRTPFTRGNEPAPITLDAKTLVHGDGDEILHGKRDLEVPQPNPLGI